MMEVSLAVVQEVPGYGIMNTAADITIIGRKLFSQGGQCSAPQEKESETCGEDPKNI